MLARDWILFLASSIFFVVLYQYSIESQSLRLVLCVATGSIIGRLCSQHAFRRRVEKLEREVHEFQKDVAEGRYHWDGRV